MKPETFVDMAKEWVTTGEVPQIPQRYVPKRFHNQEVERVCGTRMNSTLTQNAHSIPTSWLV